MGKGFGGWKWRCEEWRIWWEIECWNSWEGVYCWIFGVCDVHKYKVDKQCWRQLSVEKMMPPQGSFKSLFPFDGSSLSPHFPKKEEQGKVVTQHQGKIWTYDVSKIPQLKIVADQQSEWRHEVRRKSSCQSPLMVKKKWSYSKVCSSPPINTKKNISKCTRRKIFCCRHIT